MTTIFVVDDHALMRQTLRTILEEQLGLHVLGVAGDGMAAVLMVQHLRPDVVLMDVHMPRMHGIESTRQIRATVPRAVVIGMSLHVSAGLEKELLEAGASALLAKEVVQAELMAAITQALRTTIN